MSEQQPYDSFQPAAAAIIAKAIRTALAAREGREPGGPRT